MTDAISSPVQALLTLFSTDLADVKFPDVDGEVLARAAEEVEASAEALRLAEAALEAARSSLGDKQEALLLKAQRAHAYARVFAESDVELTGRVEAIQLARSSRRAPRTDGVRLDTGRGEASELRTAAVDAAPRRRGRPPKEAATSPLLDTAIDNALETALETAARALESVPAAAVTQP